MADNNFRSYRKRDAIAEFARLIVQAEPSLRGLRTRLPLGSHDALADHHSDQRTKSDYACF